jgi:uncharacterized protein YceH (UPF0502 family)
MPHTLSPIEIRVLGALIEKGLATPEYYPLTLNALTNACNQKSSRDPLMSLDESQVHTALASLRDKGLTLERMESGNRVAKYLHRLDAYLEATPTELATLGVLFLRGPQTTGEIRSRVGRMAQFKDLAEVEATLDSLNQRKEGPWITRLPRQAGFKEARYAHLFGGEPVASAAAAVAEEPQDRLAELTERVAALEQRLEELAQRLPPPA